ncbi:MAG TPA: cation-translocating P-type ATPase [Candidatus Egerieimonas intestinavium]|uniref:Cation-translocating P-type ATPase n=1 Tax=Candidatus Egerieimonas intestinavium TaxID=2840777 RepID=A0A9D1EIC3_9FIRM|nr:cation-translocating P-type ATPase [Candidatus Egerieimonas intestinavium]
MDKEGGAAMKNAGLTEQEAARRLEEYGPNVLRGEKREGILQRFLAQLNDPLIFVLLVAAAISILLREWEDMGIILAVVILNGTVGVIQEGKAQKALEALKDLAAPHALVCREGKVREIEAKKLVPGDLVLLDAGRQVPADIRLTEAVNLKVEESALTGESVPVSRKQGQAVYQSTYVTYGRGQGIVEATGMNTAIGKIASALRQKVPGMTPLQQKLAVMGKLLSAVTVALCLLLFAAAVMQRRDVGEMLLTAISLAVAAVPEGLPAIVTIVLALSVSRMVKIHTIVRKLPAVETLGAVTVVCSDKTGTLTQNQMQVVSCYAEGRFWEGRELTPAGKKEFFQAMVLCNDAVREEGQRMGDPSELALLDLAAGFSLFRSVCEEEQPRIGELPFDSQRKMMTTLHRRGNEKISYTKGAPDRVLARCTRVWQEGQTIPLTREEKKKILNALDSMAGRALRVMALAMGPQAGDLREQELVFLGLAGMEDPVRPEARGAVEKFARAGVRTVMITGDYLDTALAIARQLGIAREKSQCMTGEQLDNCSEGELRRRLPELSVFARVSPEHKVRIVRALQGTGELVAMTGDGVNDAPSLKMADIGVAMGKKGTDVAKEAADMVLTDDNFATIQKAMEEGRGIYENIRKSILFLLSSNFGEVLTMFLSVLAGLPAALKASHILWINLITDSLPALALGTDRGDTARMMERPPRKREEGIFADGGLACTLFYGLLIGGVSLAAFLKLPCYWLAVSGQSFSLEGLMSAFGAPGLLPRAQTYAFTVLGVSQLFHAIGMRDVNTSVFRGHRRNPLMILSVLLGIGLQVLVTEVPYFIRLFGTARLSLGEWCGLLFLALMPLAAHELLLALSKLQKRQSHKEQTAEPGKV